MSDDLILTINSGSSSLKFGLYTEINGQEHLVLEGSADGIGRNSGKIELRNAYGHALRSESRSFASQGDALDCATRWLIEFSPGKPHAIGHRVVHGGPHLLSHQRITPTVLSQLQTCLHFAPLHIPIALELIGRVEQAYPNVRQYACFDTVFHHSIPESAARFALPRSLYDEGVRRYGFHGLSYESVVHQFSHNLPNRTIIAHLGNGASLAAIKSGLSVDTTMGLTPTGGIPMATRSGDLDPGVILYLLREKQLSANSLEKLLNDSSGLLALSDGKTDMRELEEAARSGDEHAQLAIEVFCTSIRKVIASYAAVLGGLDLLVFTGGIGENRPQIRRAICRNLQFLGLPLDESDNAVSDIGISSNHRVRIAVAQSQEERQIARHCRAMLHKESSISAA